jgi:hypothetical protein
VPNTIGAAGVPLQYRPGLLGPRASEATRFSLSSSTSTLPPVRPRLVALFAGIGDMVTGDTLPFRFS